MAYILVISLYVFYWKNSRKTKKQANNSQKAD